MKNYMGACVKIVLAISLCGMTGVATAAEKSQVYGKIFSVKGFTTTFGGGGAIGYKFNNKFSAEVELLNGYIKDSGSCSFTNTTLVGVRGNYHLPYKASKLNPYMFLGVSNNTGGKSNCSGVKQSSVGLGVNVGAGVAYPVSSGVDIYSEAAFRVTKEETESLRFGVKIKF